MTTTVSVLSAILMTLLVATFAVLLVSAIVFNFKAGIRYRRALAAQLDNFRLARMLTALGIDIDEYLSTERVVDIHRHMERCGACENVGECDDRLNKGTIDAGEIGFCNNEKSLQDIARSRAHTAGTGGD